MVHYPFSTLGVYNEAIMLVRVSSEGEPYTFCPFIYVDNDAALACGRELWGFPKKFASMGYTRPAAGAPFCEQMVFTVERPAGKRLLTVTMNPDRPAAAAEVSFLPALTLRRIPNSRLGASQPSICELIRTDYSAAPAISADGTPELWTGRCSVTMDPVLGDDGFRLRVRPARRDGAGTDARRPVRGRGHHAAAGHAGQGLPGRGRGGRTASIHVIEETKAMAQFASIARPAEGTLIARWDEDPHGTLQLTGAEAPLAKEEQDLLDGVHRFAAAVMRPIGEQLDRMSPRRSSRRARRCGRYSRSSAGSMAWTSCWPSSRPRRPGSSA